MPAAGRRFPEIYDAILVREPVTPFDEMASATARIGGWINTPDLARSYLFAAHRLLREACVDGRVADVAAPVRYLQRHALELEIKAVINTAYEIAADEAHAEALRRDPQAPSPELLVQDREHGLAALVKEANAALLAIGESELPGDVQRIAAWISRIEDAQPDRWRYLTLRRPKENKHLRPPPSFAQTLVMRLGEIQAALEETFRLNFWIRDRDHQLGADASFVADIALRAEQAAEEAYRLLDEAGRGGTPWTPPPALDERDMKPT